MSFSGGVKTDDTLSKQSAKLTRAQYNDYLRRFRPLENYMIDEIDLGDLNRDVGESISLAGKQFDRTMAATEQNMDRYGISMDTDQRAAFERKKAMNKGLAQVTAANNTRDAAIGRRTRLRENVISTGRSLSSDAGSMYGQATGLEANRNATNRQIKAQEDANTMSGIGIAAGIAASFI